MESQFTKESLKMLIVNIIDVLKEESIDIFDFDSKAKMATLKESLIDNRLEEIYSPYFKDKEELKVIIVQLLNFLREELIEIKYLNWRSN